MYREVTSDCGPWHSGSGDVSPNPSGPVVLWKVDKAEDSAHRRFRLRRDFRAHEHRPAVTAPDAPAIPAVTRKKQVLLSEDEEQRGLLETAARVAGESGVIGRSSAAGGGINASGKPKTEEEGGLEQGQLQQQQGKGDQQGEGTGDFGILEEEDGVVKVSEGGDMDGPGTSGGTEQIRDGLAEMRARQLSTASGRLRQASVQGDLLEEVALMAQEEAQADELGGAFVDPESGELRLGAILDGLVSSSGSGVLPSAVAGMVTGVASSASPDASAVAAKVVLSVPCVLLTTKRKLAGTLRLTSRALQFVAEYAFDSTQSSYDMFDEEGKLKPSNLGNWAEPAAVLPPKERWRRVTKRLLMVARLHPSEKTLETADVAVDKSPDMLSDVKMIRSWPLHDLSRIRMARYLL